MSECLFDDFRDRFISNLASITNFMTMTILME